jgi:hypothetical protein
MYNSIDAIALILQFEAITADDYFIRNQEFTTWLRDSERISFNDLSTEESHELFDKFVETWNNGKLPGRYYAGLAATTRRSAHNWGFKGRPPLKSCELVGQCLADLHLK